MLIASGASVPINDDENSHSFVVFGVSTIRQIQPSSCLFSLLTEPASLFRSLAFPLPYPGLPMSTFSVLVFDPVLPVNATGENLTDVCNHGR
jgi:hypothetical protein